jgi:predicted  nucleic acid-binding Zn-ribbon protein
MMIVFRSVQFPILVMVVFLTMILTPGCATDQVSTPSEITSMEPEANDLAAAFEQTHEEILARVKEGTLPADVGAKATELKIALEKYLIKAQAQLQVLQLDVLYGTDEQRQRALKKVVALAAERERTKMAYLQRLQTLNTASLPGEKTERNGKIKDIEIEIGPERITDGERP